MKRLLIILLTLIITNVLFCPVLAQKLDLMNNSEPEADKILYEFVLKDLKMTPKKVYELARIDRQSVKALFVDLNEDGQNEIIGVVYSTLYQGTAGYSLFILKKDLNGYKNIAYIINFEPQNEILILNNKTNEYKNIKLYGSNAYKFKSFIVKYKNGFYQNEIQTESLEKQLRQ